MEVENFCSDAVNVERMVVFSVVETVVSETILVAQISLACLLIVTGSILMDIHLLPQLIETDKRFPVDKLRCLNQPYPENKDASDVENDDGDDDDADNQDDDDADDQDDDDADDEDFSGEEGAEDEDEGDPEEDPEANDNEGNADEDDDDDDDDDGDEDGDDEEDEEDEDEEEDEKPPAKKRKQN